MLLVVDTNVLIDFAKTDPTVLTLAVTHIGQVHVPREVLVEVDQIDEDSCMRLGLLVVDGTVEQLLEAGAGNGSLSFEDRLCLVLARDHGWTCVSNDRALRKACEAEGVAVLWGLQLLLRLVEDSAIATEEAVQLAEAIGTNNRWISPRVIEEVKRKLSE